MTRIRIVFVLLAVALLVPGAFLVRRALESVEVERAARHRTVAERVFDEMERFLSDFLVAEEARPVGHYRHAWSPAGSPPGVLLRSPLADPPERSFVVGYFEIDGEGRVHTPLYPRTSDGPSGWSEPTDTARAAAERLLGLVALAWPQAATPATTADERPAAAPPARAPQPGSRDPSAQQPGTTVAVGKAAAKEVAEREDEPGVVAEAYDAIQSLNRGAKLRSNRSQKVVPAEPPRLAQRELQIARADTPEPKDRDLALGESIRPRLGGELAAHPPSGSASRSSRFREDETLRDVPSPERLAAAPSAARPPTGGPLPIAEADEGTAEDTEIDFDRGFASQGRQAAAADAITATARPPREAAAGVATTEEERRRREPSREPAVGPALAMPAEAETSVAKKEDAGPAISTTFGTDRLAASAGSVVIDPMQGFDLGEDHLVLHRTVWRGPRAFRQGLIVDVAALESDLMTEAFPSQAIPGAFATIGAGDRRPAPAGDAPYRYRHRFAEPFDALNVDLALPQLAGTGGPQTIVLLSLALLLTGSVGLFALYRMVAVVVGFSERRSNFVAAVSHELKTPLTSIRMYAEMLRDGIVAGDDKRNEYYGTITAESERLSRLIDNVLEFSRLERGTREMSWSVGDLGAVAREAVAVLTPHAEAQGFSLELELERQLPPVRFDRDAVLQVVFNLVDNALKYAREARDKRIVVACASEGGAVSLAVRDHGPGVAGEHVKRIFEPFYRGESELTRRAQGTGIGLSLVRGLADEMGARLRARNRTEGGLEVKLSFHAAPAAQGS